ncbi:hypothetical protein EMCG_06019 [[Emmonsia] crescens]|uniref:Cyclohexanone monooxygenase n=1 Tax=[Emmonsia] crescens TaxID=73230 RepID=A0A0G2ICM3_9EURO|nr:hypothetical protein EMCG_06019 [Emmonsia crescens UAMH 3008]
MPPQPLKYYDALIIGAGFGGIYQLHSLLNLHLNTQPQPQPQPQPLNIHLIDESPSIGGTWYWNRYPGAMSDTESFVYRYSWDKDDLRTYPWPRHYLKQPDVLAYLEHVVRKHDLRRYMSLNMRVKGAVWDGEAGVWRVTAVKVRRGVGGRGQGGEGEVEGDEEGEEILFVARYLVTALGLLSEKNYPDIHRMSDFGGTTCHTAAWRPDINLSNKRVGVIGTGSTGVQVITEIAGKVQSLTCFQRRAQYSVPSGDGPVSASYRAKINKDYDVIMENTQQSLVGFGFEESTRTYESVPEAEREGVFEHMWKRGNGFYFMFGGFSDISTSAVANEAACGFLRKKIGEIVRDPEKARMLMPTDRYARRPLCDSGYYEQFNRDNVHIVDVGAGNPLSHFTHKGLVTRDGTEHELDVVIFATGFDAIDGNYNRLQIRGVGGRMLQEHWAERGPTSYLGISVANFPNFFMITGPQGPFCNIPPVIETQVRFVSFLIGKAELSRKFAATSTRTDAGRGSTGTIIEATVESEEEWMQRCERIADRSLFKGTSSWLFGSNVSGKKEAVRFFLGGLKNYNRVLRNVAEGRLRGFKPLVQGTGRDSNGTGNSRNRL